MQENWGFLKLKEFPKCMGNHNASLMRPKKKVHLLNETIALRVRRHSTVMQVIGKLSRRSSLFFVT
jgi:formate dehydrogenase assembly factor FdhD